MGWMGPVVDGQEHEGWVVPWSPTAPREPAPAAPAGCWWPADPTTARGTATGYG